MHPQTEQSLGSRPNLVLLACALVACVHPTVSDAQEARTSGEQVYRRYCASCHDGVTPQAPPRAALQQLPAARILRTLDFGVMMAVAYPMRRAEREAVAKFLGTQSDDAAPSAGSLCGAGRSIMSGASKARWSGWSATPSNTRFQSDDDARLTAGELGRLELKWAFGFRGDITAFAAPTVVGGTVFVGSASGAVQALDATTGCLHWVFRADGPVRSAMVADEPGAERTLLFGDQIGWVYALDVRSGRQRWKRRVEPHDAARLTGSPAVHNGVVFVPAASWEETRAIDPRYQCCTFRGSVTALDIRDGSTVWKTYLVGQPRRTGVTDAGTPTFGPSGAPVWSTPTVDPRRGLLYVTTGDNYSHPATRTSDAIVALALRNGQIAWSRQTTPGDVYNSSCGGGANCPADSGPDHDYGASAMLVRTSAGKDLLVAGQKSGMVYALDPDRAGEIVWRTRVGKGGTNGGVQWGMASDGRHVYAAVSDLVRLPSKGINAALVGDKMFDPNQGGGLTALRVETGERVWFVPGHPCDPPRPGCSPAQPGAVTAISGAVFSGSIDGHLRAFSTIDGRLLWDVNTVRAYQTVNGVSGKGGSLDGAGAVIVNGMLFVNSGYPRNGGMAGNVLLAFGPPSRARTTGR